MTSVKAALWIAPIPILVIAALALAPTMAARRWVALGVAAVAVAELLWWNGTSRLNSEGRHHYAVLEQPVVAADVETLAVLERSIGERQRGGERPRVEIMGAGGAWQNLAMVRGLEAINGYNPLRIGVYDRLIAPGETTYLSEQRTFPASFESYDCALARALGLEYVVLDRPIEQVPNLAKRPVAELLRGGPKLWLYRLRNSMPRLVFTNRVQVADADLVNTRGELAVAPSAEHVLIDDDTPPSRSYSMFGSGQSGSARIVSWRPDRIEIDVESQQGGMLVLHETYYPGWVAEIDGTRARILRADVLFRGIEVPPGRRKVVFRFAPLSFANLADALGIRVAAARWHQALELDFAFELGPVLQAVVARQPADQLEPDPFVQDAADVLARDPGHRGDVALADLLADQDAALADRLAERFRKIKQRPRHAALQRKKTSRGEHSVGVAQPSGKQRDHVLVGFGMLLGEGLERRPADELKIGARTAVTEAERGRPSRVDSSPTIAPGPRMARMRSAPDGPMMLTLSRPCSIR